ncbi:MAG TPA: 6-carboxytetrahydropterin synthase [Bacteroidales bacterium]|nr:6-carboxytetrahydropterin synthase [Bacteroidales bacterium]
MVLITRVEKFNAAHKLWVDQWSEEKNKEVFGKCSNKNWHGHNYYLHVTIKGKPDPLTGFVVDVKYLSKIIKSKVIEYIDHSNLNLDVPFIPEGMQPTTENLVIQIWKELAPHIPGEAELFKLKLYETDSIYAEYYGE